MYRIVFSSLRSRATAMVMLSLVATLLLSPATCHGQVSVPSGYVAQVFASGLDGPVELVFDRSGRLYVANEGQPGVSYPGTTVSLIDRQGSTAVFATGFMGPSGLALDGEGVLYVSDDTNSVYKVSSGQVTSFAHIDNNPNAIAFDRSDNLYVAPHVDKTVYKVTPSGVITPFATGFAAPSGLAFDQEGNLYVSNQTAGTISKVAPDGNVLNYSFAFDVGSPEGLAFAPVGRITAGNRNVAGGGLLGGPLRLSRELFVVSFGRGAIYHIDENGQVSLFAEGFNGPRRIAFSSAGDMYITEFGFDPDFSNQVWKISRRGIR